MNSEVRNTVDKLLREQGEYLPLEFLLLEGRLLSEDYEAWCSSDVSFLDEMLFGDADQILAQLTEAKNYAIALGLQSEVLQYNHWQKEDSPALVFSGNDGLNQCFHLKYRKSDDMPQMDLFMDNQVGHLVNDLTEALIKFDKVKSRRVLESLYDQAPNQSKLGEFELLVNALEQTDNTIQAVHSELQHLQHHLTAAARTIMGTKAKTWLAPFWRRISGSLGLITYDENRNKLHVSYASGQALDWKKVRSSIENEDHWWRHSTLVKRHAHACSQLGVRGVAIQSWFYLCWLHSEYCESLDKIADLEMRKKWKDFNALEPELAVETFPAWCLLEIPALRKILQNVDTVFLWEPPESFLIIYHKQNNKTASLENSSNNEFQWREKLKNSDLALFQYYISAVQASSD